MKTKTYHFFENKPQSKLISALLSVGLALCCPAVFAENNAQSVVSKLNSIQIIRGLDYQAQKSLGLNKLESGKFIGYSHKIGNKDVLDFSVNTYLYTDDSNNSVEWIIGVEHKLLNVNFYNNQATNKKYIEVVSRYPVNNSFSINGYLGKDNNGVATKQDYAVALAYSANDIEIAAGYSDRESHAQLTDGNVFVNVVGRF